MVGYFYDGTPLGLTRIMRFIAGLEQANWRLAEKHRKTALTVEAMPEAGSLTVFWIGGLVSWHPKSPQVNQKTGDSTGGRALTSHGRGRSFKLGAADHFTRFSKISARRPRR
jgi:hypothetical protein